MKVTRPNQSRSFGLLHITEEIQVLDSQCGLNGTGVVENGSGKEEAVYFSNETLEEVLAQTVIVVPCKDETLEVIRGVVSKIPAPCLVILVSNSERGVDDDQYLQQVEMLKTFGASSGQQILAIHQKDPRAARAFQASGMTELLDSKDGTIRNGKGEGMLLGIAVASAFRDTHRYIGFVDADNFDGDSANEYCKAFAAGFAMCPSPDVEHSMVRLRWASKPKLREDGHYEFVTEGRCSRIVNSWLNKLFTPTESNSFVSTGNAGEHALTIDLALKLRMAAGYAIEPYHFIDLLERGHLAVNRNGVSAQLLDKPVRILQIRTRSPHYHQSGGPEHIRKMWAAGLGAIYHNLAQYETIPGSASGGISQLRQDIHKFAAENGGIQHPTGELPRPRIYPALGDANMAKFRDVMEAGSVPTTLAVVGLGAKGQFGV